MTGSEADSVLARYADAARRVDEQPCVCADDGGLFGSAHYQSELDDLPATAVRVSLGCGNPVAVVDLRSGETVLDLGSGGGIDVLISARRVGPSGHVYGLDATPEMVDLARRNAREAGADNVEFLLGTIEDIPLDDASVDVIVSNCVIVLSRNKRAVFSEIARVLRPGGRIGISDIIRHGHDVDACVVDCAADAITADEYTSALRQAGLTEITIQPTDPIGGGLHNAIIRASRPHAGVRPMQAADWPVVREIYEAGIATGHATFETSAPDWDEWDRAHLADHRLVATDSNDDVIGWAALSPVSDRCVYGGVAENSVYVHPEHRRHGVGSALLDALIASTEAAGYWTIQTGVFPENTASLATHERAGFRIVGRRERIGQLDGVWRDSYLLERRSDRV
jgi:L-amino acid N-acyltransferase YncA/2-polyprenyl-3-methyl-5-hydroxy-6-metoxy-1,4-benzoquinol methylase